MPIRTRTALAAALAAALTAAAAAWGYTATHYFPERSLDKAPYPMRRVDLDFPPQRAGLEYYGRLRIQVRIGSGGAVDAVEVVSSGVPNEFRDAAVKAFSGTRWEPGRKWGLRVKTLKVIEVDFEPPLRGLDRPLSPDQ